MIRTKKIKRYIANWLLLFIPISASRLYRSALSLSLHGRVCMCWGGEGVVMETFCYHWCHEARPLYDFLDLLSQGYRSTVHIHINVAYKNWLLSRSLYLFQAHGTWLNIPWPSGIWQGNGEKTECELKQSSWSAVRGWTSRRAIKELVISK